MTMTSLPAPTDVANRATFGVRVDPSTRTMVLRGELDASTASVLVDSILPAMGSLGRGDVVLDISAVTFVGAAGLGAFARMHARQLAGGHELVITGASPAARKVFAAGGMQDLLRLH